MSAGLQIARGARATEDVLLAAIARHAEAVRADPRRLGHPLRVVVPSRSLRQHLAATALRRTAPGGALAGVSIHTLHGLAYEILRAAGKELREADLIFPAVVRQCARREAVLSRVLDGLEDGYGACVATVTDLLDAGFEPELAPACEAGLEEGAPGEAVQRALALLRVAVASLGRLEELGLEHRSALFRRARRRLEEVGVEALPAAEIWIHGYADATGVQTDLLRALTVHAGARVLLDHPPDPAAPEAPPVPARFLRRLEDDLGGFGAQPSEPVLEAAPSPPKLELLRAAGAQAEARVIAERIRGLLDAGARPEGIGIVLRHLSSHQTALRLQLRRLAVPFSGAPGSGGPLSPAGRQLRALLDLLRSRESLHADRWLDAQRSFRDDRSADLRVAFHALGATRLRDVAALDVDLHLGDADSLGLPVRRGFAPGSPAGPGPLVGSGGAEAPGGAPGDEGDSEPGDAEPLRARRRHLPRQVLEAAVQSARAALGQLDATEGAQRLAEHLDALRVLCRDGLGWQPDVPASRELERALGGLQERLTGELRLEFPELVPILERALAWAGREALGGAGAGVQLLSVTQARARSFEHLFVPGLNRDLFPRVVMEDPLLPDLLRRRLEPVLPNVPIKARGFEEERYLFAQLVSASPRVILSCQVVSDDGKERTASPLFERIRLTQQDAAVPLVPSVLAGGGEGAMLRTAREHAVRAGLAGQRARFSAALEQALVEARQESGLPPTPGSAAALTAARVALVRELERAGDPRGSLGPFFGAVGPRRGADPRRADPAVTVLERLVYCPWQTFLQKVMGLESAPDSRSALPALSPLLVGNLLHRVLERIGTDAGVATGGALDSALSLTPCDVPWPGDAELRALLAGQAEAVVREAGISFPGFARLLVARTAPYLERVRELDWGAGSLAGVVGIELDGELVLPRAGGVRRLRFRADRADRADRRDGGVILSDYKSGKPLSDARTAETRREHLLTRIGRGESLQAAVYAFAEGVSEGRYLFAGPDAPEENAVVRVLSGDAEARHELGNALEVLLDAWDEGLFPPRLLKQDRRGEPRRCEWCDVSEACLRGDSGARQRLGRWLDAQQAKPADRDAARRVALLGLAEASS